MGRSCARHWQLVFSAFLVVGFYFLGHYRVIYIYLRVLHGDKCHHIYTSELYQHARPAWTLDTSLNSLAWLILSSDHCYQSRLEENEPLWKKGRQRVFKKTSQIVILIYLSRHVCVNPHIPSLVCALPFSPSSGGGNSSRCQSLPFPLLITTTSSSPFSSHALLSHFATRPPSQPRPLTSPCTPHSKQACQKKIRIQHHPWATHRAKRPQPPFKSIQSSASVDRYRVLGSERHATYLRISRLEEPIKLASGAFLGLAKVGIMRTWCGDGEDVVCYEFWECSACGRTRDWGLGMFLFSSTGWCCDGWVGTFVCVCVLSTKTEMLAFKKNGEL